MYTALLATISAPHGSHTWARQVAYLAALASTVHTGMGSCALLAHTKRFHVQLPKGLEEELSTRGWKGLWCKPLQRSAMMAIRWNAIRLHKAMNRMGQPMGHPMGQQVGHPIGHTRQVWMPLPCNLEDSFLKLFGPISKSVSNDALNPEDLWFEPGTRYMTLLGYDPHLKATEMITTSASACFAAGYDVVGSKFQNVLVLNPLTGEMKRWNIPATHPYVLVKNVDDAATLHGHCIWRYLISLSADWKRMHTKDPCIMYKTTVKKDMISFELVDTKRIFIELFKEAVVGKGDVEKGDVEKGSAAAEGAQPSRLRRLLQTLFRDKQPYIESSETLAPVPVNLELACIPQKHIKVAKQSSGEATKKRARSLKRDKTETQACWTAGMWNAIFRGWWWKDEPPTSTSTSTSSSSLNIPWDELPQSASKGQRVDGGGDVEKETKKYQYRFNEPFELIRFKPFSDDLSNYIRTYASERGMRSLILPPWDAFSQFWVFYVTSSRTYDSSFFPSTQDIAEAPAKEAIFNKRLGEYLAAVKALLGPPRPQTDVLDLKHTWLVDMFPSHMMKSNARLSQFHYHDFQNPNYASKITAYTVVITAFNGIPYATPIIWRITQCNAEPLEQLNEYNVSMYKIPYACNREPTQWYIQQYAQYHYPTLVPRVVWFWTGTPIQLELGRRITVGAVEYWHMPLECQTDRKQCKFAMDATLLWALLFLASQLSRIGIEHMDMLSGNCLFRNTHMNKVVRYVWTHQDGQVKQVFVTTRYHSPFVIDFEYSHVTNGGQPGLAMKPVSSGQLGLAMSGNGLTMSGNVEKEEEERTMLPFEPNVNIPLMSFDAQVAEADESLQLADKSYNPEMMCMVDRWINVPACFAPGELNRVASNCLPYLIEIYMEHFDPSRPENTRTVAKNDPLAILYSSFLQRLYRGWTQQGPVSEGEGLTEMMTKFFSKGKRDSLVQFPGLDAFGQYSPTVDMTTQLDPQSRPPWHETTSSMSFDVTKNEIETVL